MLGRVLAIVGLLALNGFFVAAEFSVVRPRRSRLEAMARSGDAKARIVLRATANLARLLSASQFGITLASIGIGALAEESLSHAFASAFGALPLPARIGTATIGTVCALAVVTYGHVVFGELAPRSAALNHPEEVSRWLVPPLMLFAWLTKPFTILLNASAEFVLRLFGQKAVDAEENVHSADELRILVEQSQEVGALAAQRVAEQPVQGHRGSPGLIHRAQRLTRVRLEVLRESRGRLQQQLEVRLAQLLGAAFLALLTQAPPE